MDEDLTLRESATLVEGVADDGTVLLHLIRPCVGRGRGRHVYEADMLEENAHKFQGWKMYVDHQSPEARKAQGGLPRSIRDLGGRILESWWDPSVPANDRFGRGAVVGRAKPTPFVRSLVESDPELVETSINSMATGVKPVMRDGKRALLVEGIQPKGSVDWVTEAGAGGKVVALMEASVAEDEALDALDDDDLRAYIEETRPGLVVEAAKTTTSTKSDDGDGKDSEGSGDDDGELEALVAKLCKKGMPRKMAEKVAKRQMAGSVKEHAGEDEDMGEITGEMLAEAVRSPEFTSALREVVEAAVEERMEEERDLWRAEARADADRQVELRDYRDAAHAKINEAKLPDALAAQLRDEFTLVEGVPTPRLDVTDEYSADGDRVKLAQEALNEAVEESIAKARELLGALNPTLVEGMPGASGSEGKPSGEQKSPLTSALLEGAGFENVDEVYSQRA